jgi:thioesterase domain-containing protein
VNLPDFLAELQSREIRLWADGDRLRCNGPVGVLTPELRDRMQQRKTEILEFLRTAEAVAQSQPAIVPLQPRGGRVPVFAVAGHNGDVFAYRALAEQLGQDQPFFGLRPPGLDGRTEPIARVEDLAAHFAKQIVAFRPKGPVILAGYCAGGTIAFSLAQDLERRGVPVVFLALFGCPYPTSFRFRTVRRALAHARDANLGALYRGLRNAVTAVASPRAEMDEVSMMRARLERTTIAAIRRHVPIRFSGRVSLILPNRAWRRAPTNPLQWLSKAPDADVYFGPDDCERDCMLLQPFVCAIAGLFVLARDRTGTPTELKQGA